MCIIYFGTLDNTFSFYSLSPDDQTFLRDKYPDAGHVQTENLVADQSCTLTQHTRRCKWPVCVH